MSAYEGSKMQERDEDLKATYAAPPKEHNDLVAAVKPRELTFGQKAVGLTFNPGGNTVVNEIKSDFAGVIDLLYEQKEKATNGEVKRMYSVAITEAQAAQMWAVKAATWQY